MSNSLARATRGRGLLESFFAQQRRTKALRLLAPHLPLKRVLDIGCGAFPLLLHSMTADERFGIDQAVDAEIAQSCASQGIHLRELDLGANLRLPFDSGSFDAVTMLAVIEHLTLETSMALLVDVHRVLRPGAVFIATTPAGWTGGILTVLAKCGLLSAEEIEEHKVAFSRARLESCIAAAGFGDQVETGSFELGMNLWARAVKAK